MSTRSRVGIENDDGTISSIYVHFDGYWSGVGETLMRHYTTAKQVKSLIALGYASSLEPTLKETKSQAGHDAGPDSIVLSDNQQDYYDHAQESWAEYVYLFKNGHWIGTEVGGACGPLLAHAEQEASWCRLKLMPMDG
jgi:hypothetical protein